MPVLRSASSDPLRASFSSRLLAQTDTHVLDLPRSCSTVTDACMTYTELSSSGDWHLALLLCLACVEQHAIRGAGQGCADDRILR